LKSQLNSIGENSHQRALHYR